MKQFISALAACSMLLLASCSNPRADKAKAFADEFASLVNSDNLDPLIAIYPDAALADSLHLVYNPDSVRVSETDTPDNFEINYGNGVCIVVNISLKKSTVKVISSTGLFVYPYEKLSFARKVGAIDGTLDDKTIAERLTEVEMLTTALFNNYVASRKNAILNLGLKTTDEPLSDVETNSGYYTLMNISDQPLSGDDYQISWYWWDYSRPIGYESRYYTKKGVDIPAGGSVRIPVSFNNLSGMSISGISINTPSIEDFFRQYQPTGKEYGEYIAKHGKSESAITAKASEKISENSTKLRIKSAYCLYQLDNQADNSYSPRNMTDGNPATTWAVSLSNIDNTYPDGIIPGPVFTLAKPSEITAVELQNGYCKNSEAFENNTRATMVTIYRYRPEYDGEYDGDRKIGYIDKKDIIYEGAIADNMSMQYFKTSTSFDNSQPTRAVGLLFHKGKFEHGAKWDDLCLSQIQIYGR